MYKVTPLCPHKVNLKRDVFVCKSMYASTCMHVNQSSEKRKRIFFSIFEAFRLPLVVIFNCSVISSFNKIVLFPPTCLSCGCHVS